MAKVKERALQKRKQYELTRIQVSSPYNRMLQPVGLWVIGVMLFASGAVAIVQGGLWVALIIYVVNLLAILWHTRK